MTWTRLSSGTIVAAFAAVWVCVLTGGIVTRSLRLEAEASFYLMLFTSGTLAGSVVSAATRHLPGNGVLMMLMMAGLGVYRYFHGDEGGLILALMLGGCAIGSLTIMLLPTEPEPEEEPVERSWDED